MGLVIRRLTIDDMEVAAEVHRRAFDERLPSLAGLHTPQEDREFFRSVFDDTEMWGAFDVQLVGFIAFANGWVEHLYVLPEWQGRGIGKTLLEIAKAKWPRLKLWTFEENNSAMRFYERNGFVPIDTTDGASNEQKARDVLYRWVRAEEPSFGRS